MREFLFIFRNDFSAGPQGTPEERQAITQRWMDWIGSIAAQDKLASQGRRLAPTGKVVISKKVVTNGPYAEIKETIGGFSVVKAASYDEAVQLAKGCPIFAQGGNVEVREVNRY